MFQLETMKQWYCKVVFQWPSTSGLAQCWFLSILWTSVSVFSVDLTLFQRWMPTDIISTLFERLKGGNVPTGFVLYTKALFFTAPLLSGFVDVWWVMWMPVSQYFGCQILRASPSHGQMDQNCLGTLWGIAGMLNLINRLMLCHIWIKHSISNVSYSYIFSLNFVCF